MERCTLRSPIVLLRLDPECSSYIVGILAQVGESKHFGIIHAAVKRYVQIPETYHYPFSIVKGFRREISPYQALLVDGSSTLSVSEADSRSAKRENLFAGILAKNQEPPSVFIFDASCPSSIPASKEMEGRIHQSCHRNIPQQTTSVMESLIRLCETNAATFLLGSSSDTHDEGGEKQ